MTAYGVLSRGLLTGSRPGAQGDFRGRLPRFTGENLASNQRLVDALAEAARARGSTPGQLAIAWALSRGDDVVALVGARTRAQLKEALAAASLPLTDSERLRLEQIVPAGAVAGARYGDHEMQMLDSERA